MVEINLNDERLHRRRIPWETLVREGYEPKKVMLEAQKQRMWTLAKKAEHRLSNQRQAK
jgi:hypothetical protein